MLHRVTRYGFYVIRGRIFPHIRAEQILKTQLVVKIKPVLFHPARPMPGGQIAYEIIIPITKNYIAGKFAKNIRILEKIVPHHHRFADYFNEIMRTQNML